MQGEWGDLMSKGGVEALNVHIYNVCFVGSEQVLYTCAYLCIHASGDL